MARRPTRRRRPVRHPRGRFKAARRAAGLTQTQLAEMADCTVATIYDIESGRNRQPAYTKMARIVTSLRSKGVDITAEQALGLATTRRAHPRTRRNA